MIECAMIERGQRIDADAHRLEFTDAAIVYREHAIDEWVKDLCKKKA